MTCNLSLVVRLRKMTKVPKTRAAWKSYLMVILSIREISTEIMLTSRTEPFSIRSKLTATSRFHLTMLGLARTKCKPFWISKVRETSEAHRLSKLWDLMVRSIIMRWLIQHMWVRRNRGRPRVSSNSTYSYSGLMWESPTVMRNGSIHTTTSQRTSLIISQFEKWILTWFVPETTSAIVIPNVANNSMNIKSIWISFTRRILVFYSLAEATSKEMMTTNEWQSLRSIRIHRIIC